MAADKREEALTVAAIPPPNGSLAGSSPAMVSPGSSGTGGDLRERNQVGGYYGCHHKPAGDLYAKGDGEHR